MSWLLGKFDAAESVWRVAAAAAAAGGSLADYALVPSGDEDLDFFCADWSNEMLMTAGVRNDDGDYFKVILISFIVVIGMKGTCMEVWVYHLLQLLLA